MGTVHKLPTEKDHTNVDTSAVLYPNIYTNNGFIYVLADNGYEDRVAKETTLIAIKKNIDTFEVNLLLSTEYNGDIVTKEINRSELTRQELLKLLAYGFDIHEANVRFVILHLLNQEHTSLIQFIHSTVGFGTYQGTPVFKHSNTIGVSSTYCGNLKIHPIGSSDNWLKMVNSYVMEHVPLQLALVLGFTAAVVGFIGKDVSLDTLIVHIYNDSTKGKTTAMMLALSAFGCPDPKTAFSLGNTWMATENYMASILNGNYGLPVGFDELSMFDSNKNLSSLVYRMASNKDKGRLNKDASVKASGEWSTLIISTGEGSLLSRCSQNMGLRMRVLELGHILWTPDAKTSEAIKQNVLQNYGHAGVIFAEKLISLGKDEVIRLWEEWRSDIKQAITDAEKNRFADRTAAKLAPIMVAADIAGELFNLNFNLDGILQLLVDSEQDDEEPQDLGTNAYEYFLQQFNKYRRHFGIPENIETQYFKSKDPNGRKTEYLDTWGNTYTNTNKKEMEIRVIKSEFDRIMKEGGFQDSKVILRAWKEKRLLDCEKDRYTRKIKIRPQGTITLVYCIKVNLQDLSESQIPKAEESEFRSTTQPKISLGKAIETAKRVQAPTNVQTGKGQQFQHQVQSATSPAANPRVQTPVSHRENPKQ